MPTTEYTFCRNCTAQCGLEVTIEDNRLLSVTGDKNQPLTKGYFCPKALASNDIHNGEDRLFAHRKGRGAAQTGIEAQPAFDEIGERLRHIIDEHGPRAVGLYFGTGANMNAMAHSAFRAFMHALGSPYIFSSMTLDQSAKWVNISRMGMFAPGPRYIHDADVGLMVGSNTVLTHAAVRGVPAANPRKWLKQGKENGLKLIVVDPRLTETARLADLHLQIRPGEDVWLFGGMIRLVLDNSWENREFCDRWIGSLDALREAVREFDFDRVAERTGLPSSQIEEATKLFATAARPSAATGTGPNMSPRSNLAEHLVMVLNAICVGYRRAGDPVTNTGYLFGPNEVQERIIPPNRSWECEPKLRSRDTGRIFGEFPTALLPDEIIGKGEDRLRALIVVGGNPAMALVDPGKSLAAFDALELLVTLDVRSTETTAISDYVISTSLPYEHDDITGMFDGYNPIAYANVVRGFMERPPGIVDDWEFFWEIARRLGLQLELKRPQYPAAYETVVGPTLALDMTAKPEVATILRFYASTFGRTDYDELVAAPHGVRRDDLVNRVLPASQDDGFRLELLPPDVARELAEAIAEPRSEAFKYRLTTRRLLYTVNSAYRHAGRTRKRFSTNPASMNPSDMAAEGLETDDWIRITSAHGSVVARVEADPTIRSGAISLSHLWGKLRQEEDPDGRTGAFSGHLSSLDIAELESINFMPIQSAVPINIALHSKANAACDEARV